MNNGRLIGTRQVKFMTAPLNKSEQFTHDLCTRSFLSLWCYNNPIGKKNKELCDVLVVCDPDVIVFSVKEIELEDPDNQDKVQRWKRKAIDESLKQVYGATTWLETATNVIHSDGTTGIPLPPVESRRIHRVAVAFGSKGACSIGAGDFGKGHVHVFTEESLSAILNELDTITDFVDYLAAKERFFSSPSSIVINGTEADLLGFYLHSGRSFPERADFLIIDTGVWDELCSKPVFMARKKEDIESYKWDKLIEILCKDEAYDHSGLELNPTEREFVIRGMAREDRFCRRVLSSGLIDFLRDAKAGKSRSRIMCSPSLSIYVLAHFAKGEDRNARLRELAARCLVARNKIDESSDVVMGIGFNEFDPSAGTPIDLVYLRINPEDNEWREKATVFEEELGYFKGRPMTKSRVDEYPEP